MSRHAFLVGCAVVGALTAGCDLDEDDDCDHGGSDVRLAIEVTSTNGGLSNRIIMASGLVWNAGNEPVLVSADCCGVRPLLMITDPNGQIVRVNECLLDCLGRVEELGDTPRAAALFFDGTVFKDGDWVVGPVGRYTVTARFSYREYDGGPLETVQRETTFDWYLYR